MIEQLRMKYGMICQFATIGANAMPIIMHVFDGVTVSEGQPRTPPLYIHAVVDAPSNAGTHHQAALELRDDDGRRVVRHDFAAMILEPRRDGLGLSTNVFAAMAEVQVPDFGTYTWVLLVDDVRIGEIPITVSAAAPARAPT